MENRISVVINTILNNTGVINLHKSVDGITKATASFSDKLGRASANFTAISELANRTKDVFVKIFGGAVNDADELNAAMTGLKSIVEGTGNDFKKAEGFIEEFTADGLVGTTEAATSLKNLLSRGFGLEEAKQIMDRFKDSAAFGRQSSLELGEAIQGATEGIKNENSVLVDNAGVTKNVSVMWQEYADSIGVSVKNLTLEQKREAELQGILKETRFQVGDAKKLTEQYGGQKAKLLATIKKLSQTIGSMFLPILSDMIKKVTPIVSGIQDWIKANPELSKKILLVAAGVGGLLVAIAGIAPLIPIISSLGAVFALLVSPIGLVIGAITALGIAYNTNFLGIQEIINNFLAKMGEAFSWVVEQFNIIADFIIEYFERIQKPIMTFVEFIQPYIEEFLMILLDLFTETFDNIVIVLEGAWEIIKGIFEITIGIIGGIVELFLNVFTGNWEGAWQALKNMTALVWNGIKDVFSGVFKVIQAVVSEFISILKALFSGLWVGLKAIFNAGLKAIQHIVSLVWNGIKTVTTTVWNTIKSFLSGIWKGLKDFCISIWDGLKISLSNIWNGILGAATSIFTSISDSITGIFKGAVDFIVGTWEKIKKIWGWITGAKKDTSNELGAAQNKKDSMQAQGYSNRAFGGLVSAGSPYMVGERGRELFIPETNGRIVSHDKIGGHSFNITISGNTISNEADEERLANKVIEKLNYQLQMSKFGIS